MRYLTAVLPAVALLACSTPTESQSANGGIDLAGGGNGTGPQALIAGGGGNGEGPVRAEVVQLCGGGGNGVGPSGTPFVLPDFFWSLPFFQHFTLAHIYA